MTATLPVGPSAPSTPASRAATQPRWWDRALGWHVAAYALLLLALVPLARPGVATIDEGAYGIQARQVAEGSWAYPEGLARFDPDGRYFPITLSEQVGGEWYAYIKHPAVPVLMAAITRAAGERAGLVALPLLGALAAAAVAWGIAAEWDRRRSPLAFWLVAGSPIAFHAYVTWAHALAAALAGGVFWAMVRIGRRGPSVGRVSALALTLAGGALVRSEGVLVGVAVLGVLAVVLGRSRRPRAAVLSTAAPAAVLAATLWLERRWVEAIVGGAAPQDLTMRAAPGGPSLLVGRLQGAWISVVRGSSSEIFALRGLVLPVAVCILVAVVLRAGRSPRHEVELALASLVAALLAVWAGWPTSLLTGLVPAAPLLVLGVVVAWRRRSEPSLAWLMAAMAGFASLVLATQYADGGGFQWGGRFFSALLVPAAAAAALGIGALIEDRPMAVRRTTTGALAALGIVAGLMPVVALGTTRAEVGPIYDEVAASASAANVTTSQQLPRLMWRQDLDWLVASPDEVGDLLETMRRGGVEQVTAVVPETLPLAELGRWSEALDRGDLDQTGLRIVVLRR